MQLIRAVEMHASHQMAVISGLSQGMGDCGNVGGQEIVIGKNAGLVRFQPGQESSAGGDA
jgi:hypothetical protein